MEQGTFRPSNSVVIIGDFTNGEIPPSFPKGKIFSASQSCVAIGCRPDMDGSTRIKLGSEHEIEVHCDEAFRSQVKTSDGKITVFSVLQERFLQIPWNEEKATIRIWVDDIIEPTEISIIVGRDL